MGHVYGASIVHKVRAFAGTTPVSVHSLVSARLYPAKPSQAELDDADGELGGFAGTMMTTFSASDAANKVYTVTFDAVSDPTPAADKLYDVWHPVANVRLEADQQIQTLYKPIVVWRAVPQLSQLDVDVDDVYDIEGEIHDVLGDADTLKKIGRAKSRVLKRIESKGLDRARLQEIDLSEAVIYLAASMCLMDMSTDKNDYYRKAKDLSEQYNEIWDSLKPGYDENNDGLIDPEEKQSTFTPVFLIR